MSQSVEAIRWEDGALILLDQTKLPGEEVYLHCTEVEPVCEAIRRLSVRGAPAIGITAAFGLIVGIQNREFADFGELYTQFRKTKDQLARTRPTAINLFWALDRMDHVCVAQHDRKPFRIVERLLEEAQKIHQEDIEMNQMMGELCAELIPDEANILTHCNAGALATGGYGTALGVIRHAHRQGKKIHVWIDETRPLLQGARLTAWELMREGIPCTLVTDNMAAHLMATGKVDLAVVGSDRTVANGDVCNKIGTYGVAVLCHHHGIPFYAVLPSSTIDLEIESGETIPIEERDPREVYDFHGVNTAPEGVQAYNPAFDVTPARYVTAIITEKDIVRPPYKDSLRYLFGNGEPEPQEEE